MTAHDTGALAFLGLLVGFVVGLALFLDDQAQSDVWTPATAGPPITTEVP